METNRRAGRSIGTRVCYQCGRDVLIEDFHKDKSRNDGLSTNCKSCRNAAHKARYKKNGANWFRKPYDGPGANRKLREEVFAHYGTSCDCCGETTYEFLCVDHTEGGGNEHRRKHLRNKGGNLQLRWLKKNNFPPGFRILCYNCNNSLAFHKFCPHRRGELRIAVTATRLTLQNQEVQLNQLLTE